jgi:hypothetical protein
MANLITLADYKTAEGIQATKDDAKLELLISSVSQLVKTYCNNTFVDHYSSAKTETFNIDYEECFVQLTESPIVAITSVKERDDALSSYTTLTNNEDYYVDSTTDSIYRLADGGAEKAFKKGKGAVQVIYTAGYNGASNLPGDLQLAVIDLITYYHKDEHKARQTIAGASIQNQGSTSQRNNVAFPDHIKRVLDLYKNF